MMQARDTSRRITCHVSVHSHDQNKEGKMALRKGPWTREEDTKLVDCITLHGEGHWDSLACLAGLNRTGQSCRFRWLNYLRPTLRRGNLTIQEQLLILELHCRFGNRWSRIAEHLPGRTDNEIKNYWRTRVQKQARRLNCDANSYYFRYVLQSLWLPRLTEKSCFASSGLFDLVQSSNCDDQNTLWTPQAVAAIQTGLNSPNFTGYESRQIQGYHSSYTQDVPPTWNESLESHDSNEGSLEGFLNPFLRDIGYLELDNQAFLHSTEPVSPDTYITGENFWLLAVEEQTLESLINSSIV